MYVHYDAQETERHDVQLPPQLSSAVPDGFLPSDLQRRITATTSIYQTTTRSHSTLRLNTTARRAFLQNMILLRSTVTFWRCATQVTSSFVIFAASWRMLSVCISPKVRSFAHGGLK